MTIALCKYLSLMSFIRSNKEDNSKGFQGHHIHKKELEKYFCYTNARSANCDPYVIKL